ncbi:DNA mismatch repair endonuclease MutL [Halobacterium zhouii]|uniref:DNA mismatch repair endonuclease MutL n=1 Tax=Halobacterium zhouii TaxID=2902624 RepID=UPI001E35B2F1|nr:DNA mismatch repair endonuclease MutL [Halobacterium zhouii]
MTASDRIRELDDATVAQIAAGEVVERPASVVKELVENSLDADASRIDVTVESGGTEGITVADDGDGMTADGLRSAVRQHTTSKLGDASDLDGVATLGFRGEALYTIGSVSRMTVSTRRRDAGDAGAELTVDHGDAGDVRSAGRPAGTTVEVQELFAETPARRKYLKREATEFAHVNRAVTRYALANPDVAVSLTHDGREVFATTGTGDVRDAALSVYGREVAQSLRRVDAELGDTSGGGGETDGAVERVHGYVSDPEVTRATREYLATFVNGRSVRDSILREAVLDGYGGQLANDRYPFAVLFVEVDGVDANVHPRKMEVRFEDEAGVKRAVRDAVRGALLDSGLVRSQAPRGKSKPGDAPVSPERRDSSGVRDSDGVSDQNEAGDPRAQVASERRGSSRSEETRSSSSSESTGATETTTGASEAEHDTSGSRFSEPTENARLVDDEGASEPADASTPADGHESDDDFESLPDLRVLGQLQDTYVVAETDDGLVLVDQHAADERVQYERLRERLDGTSQSLVQSVELNLTAGEAAVFEDALPALRELGFEASLAERTAIVEAVPAVIADALDPELARDVLADFVADAGGDLVADAADELLSDMACRPAVTGNTSLAEGRIVALLDALDDCENPFACPHGRPTVVRVDGDELATRFERDYPGHGGRRREDAGN